MKVVFGQNFEGLPGLDDGYMTRAVGNVDPTRRCDGRGGIASARQTLLVELVSRFHLHTDQMAGFTQPISKSAVNQRRRHVGRAGIETPEKRYGSIAAFAPTGSKTQHGTSLRGGRNKDSFATDQLRETAQG